MEPLDVTVVSVCHEVDGANSFLQKPVDFDQFDELIRHVGYYWVNLNRNPEQITLVAEVAGDKQEEDLVVLS